MSSLGGRVLCLIIIAFIWAPLVSASFGFGGQIASSSMGGTFYYNITNNYGINGTSVTLANIINNGDGTYEWQFSDGFNFTTGNLKGSSGSDGINGLNGSDGITPIFNATQFTNATSEWSIDLTWLDVFVTAYNYITTWLIPDTSNGYLYNDSTNIFFNDTKLIDNFAPINYGDSWNKTYADTLYSTISEPLWTGNSSVVLAKISATDLADWTAHNSYPAACSAGQFVTTIGDTLTCATPAGSNYTKYISTGANAWAKPASGTWVRVQIWAGGGSGGSGAAADAGGGGGGGGYAEWIFPMTEMNNSGMICNVGAGGASVAGTDLPGNAGGTTTFSGNGTTYSVYGGGGGFGLTSADGGGGGGGGIWGPGQVGVAAAGGVGGIGCGAAGAGVAAGIWGDKCGGGGGTTVGGYASWGGGGGGYGQDTGIAYGGGNSIWGGGGGAGGDGAGVPEGVGGTSIYGGAGGTGNTDVGAGQAGFQPAGGGGGTESGTTGKGGDGQCIITVW